MLLSFFNNLARREFTITFTFWIRMENGTPGQHSKILNTIKFIEHQNSETYSYDPFFSSGSRKVTSHFLALRKVYDGRPDTCALLTHFNRLYFIYWCLIFVNLPTKIFGKPSSWKNEQNEGHSLLKTLCGNKFEHLLYSFFGCVF